MKFEKLKIEGKKFDLNLKFYFLLKYLVKSKLTENQALDLLEKINLIKKGSAKTSLLIDYTKEFEKFCNSLKGKEKKELLLNTFEVIESIEDIDLFLFSIKLYLIKDLLLAEAKIRELADVDRLNNLDPLSLTYDKISVKKPYSTRVNATLITLLFFSKLENNETNFVSEDAQEFIKKIALEAQSLKKKGLESNHIFMIMFSESINQSIISDSGSNYEDRILMVLKTIGIKESDIKKTHDKSDSSTEFDFYFNLNGKTIGIGAKRTLRERYKQFIKTAQMSHIDVMIEITLGFDLNEEKAKSIRQHGVYIFVSDEIYNSRDFSKIEGVYSIKKLNLETLKSLS